MNVLLGRRYEPFLADFGLARIVNSNGDDDATKPSQRPHLAGSYGYMAPGMYFFLYLNSISLILFFFTNFISINHCFFFYFLVFLEHASMQRITEKSHIWVSGFVTTWLASETRLTFLIQSSGGGLTLQCMKCFKR